MGYTALGLFMLAIIIDSRSSFRLPDRIACGRHFLLPQSQSVCQFNFK
jgi:hypothetical protein